MQEQSTSQHENDSININVSQRDRNQLIKDKSQSDDAQILDNSNNSINDHKKNLNALLMPPTVEITQSVSPQSKQISLPQNPLQDDLSPLESSSINLLSARNHQANSLHVRNRKNTDLISVRANSSGGGSRLQIMRSKSGKNQNKAPSQSNSPREAQIYHQLENQSHQLNSIWDDKQSNRQLENANENLTDIVKQTSTLLQQQSIQKQIAEYKKQLSEEYQSTLKQQISTMKENLEKDYNKRINALKEGYNKELKTFKDQHDKQRAQLKNKEKLIQKLLRLSQKQEFHLSTEDYRVYLEFDREPQLNMLDLTKIKQDQQKKQFELDRIEIDTTEYIELKQNLKDLEMQNQLLLQQTRVLKSKTFREIGTAQEIHFNTYKQKLLQQNVKSKSGSQIMINSSQNQIPMLNNNSQSLIGQKYNNSGVFDINGLITDGVQREFTNAMRDQFLLQKQQEIMLSRRSTYEESILIKQLQNLSQGSPDSKSPNNQNLIIDMMKIGIPPRPQEEVKEEIEIIQKASIDSQVFRAIELQKEEQRQMKLGYEKDIQEKDIIIKHLNERLDKLRIELKKAVLLLKQKTQHQQYQMLKIMQTTANQDISQVLEKGLENIFEIVNQQENKLTPEDQDEAIFQVLQNLKLSANERQIYNMKTLNLKFFDQPDLLGGSGLGFGIEGIKESHSNRSASHTFSNQDEYLLNKYIKKKSKQPLMMRLQLQEYLLKRRKLQSQHSYQSDSEIEKSLHVQQIFNKTNDPNLSVAEQNMYKEQIKEIRKLKLMQKFNNFKSKREFMRNAEGFKVDYEKLGIGERILSSSTMKPESQMRAKTPTITYSDGFGNPNSNKRHKKVRNIAIQQLDSDDIGAIPKGRGSGFGSKTHRSGKVDQQQITHLQLVSTALAMKKLRLQQDKMNKTSSNLLLDSLNDRSHLQLSQSPEKQKLENNEQINNIILPEVKQ
eukprot:403339836